MEALAPIFSAATQGTVPGSLLFSLYMNEILSDSESEMRPFTDDCVCYHEIKDGEDINDLRLNTRISNVCTKANRTLGFLRRNMFLSPGGTCKRSSL